MSSPLVLHFSRPAPLKASLGRSCTTPHELRALVESYIRCRPDALDPLADWLRVSVPTSPRRIKRRG